MRTKRLKPEHLKALEHLDAVIAALEALGELRENFQRALVRAGANGPREPQVGQRPAADPATRPATALEAVQSPAGKLEMVRWWLAEGKISPEEATRLLEGPPGYRIPYADPLPTPLYPAPAAPEGPQQGMAAWMPSSQATNEIFNFSQQEAREPYHRTTFPVPITISGTANLPTPERLEFEAARKVGKTIPADVSELQAERLAFLAQKRGERQGLMEQFAGAKAGPAAGVSPGEDAVTDLITEGAPLNVSGS